MPDPITGEPDPDELRRNLAITLGSRPPMMEHLGLPSAPPSPDVAAPSSLPDQGRIPNLAISPPNVKGPRGTLDADKAERTRQLQTGAGVDQIYGKVTNSGFGQAHPLIGKILGGLGEGIAKAGDIGLSAVAPALAINLPGTEYHHQAGLNRLNRQIGTEEGEQEKEAQTTEAQARAHSLMNPPEKQEEAGKTITTDQGIMQWNPETQRYDISAGKTAPKEGITPEEQTYSDLLGQVNPATGKNYTHGEALQTIRTMDAKQARPDTPEQQFIDEFTKSHPNGSVADAIHAYAAATQKPERGPTVIQTTNEADKLAGRLGKPYETGTTQGQGKMDRIDQTLRSIDAGYVGQGLAIPELLTSVVSGQGTGVRITQPELNMITAHRGIKGNAESFFNSLAGKGNLTATDKAQIKSVLGDAKTRLMEKMQLMNDAQDAINGASSREEVVNADKKFRAIQLGMEKYIEVRRDDQGNYYGSNDGGKTTYDLATGREAK